MKHTEIHNYTEINQLFGGEICWNFLENWCFPNIFPFFSLLLKEFEKFLDVFFDFCHFEVAWYYFGVLQRCFTDI